VPHQQGEPWQVLAKFAALRKAYDPTKAIHVAMPDGTRKVYYEVVVDLYDTLSLTVGALTAIVQLGGSHPASVDIAIAALAGREYQNA
jgi:hypothetical protein